MTDIDASNLESSLVDRGIVVPPEQESPLAAGFNAIQSQVASIGADTPVDAIAETLCRLKFCMDRAKELKKMLDAQLLARVLESGDVTIGTVRYYAATPPVTKERGTPEQTLDGLFKALNGDFTAISRCLASGWYKTGAIKTELEDAGNLPAFDKLFVTTRDAVLEEGKPVKKLIAADERFIKPRKQAK